MNEILRLGFVHTSDPEMAAYLLNLAAASAIANAIAFEDEAMLTRVVRQAKELFVETLAPWCIGEALQLGSAGRSSASACEG